MAPFPTTLFLLSLLPTLAPTHPTPQITTHHPAVFDPNRGGLIPTRGDVLSRTKCFCQTSPPSSTYGSFYNFDYYNFHSELTYSLNWTCNAGSTDYDPPRTDRLPSICLPYSKHSPQYKREDLEVKHCIDDEKGNTFCYQTGYKDFYFFNRDKRGLPGRATNVPEREGDVENLCAARCLEEVGGMVMLDPIVGDGVGGDEYHRDMRSFVQTFEKLDDMCDECA